MFNRRIRRAIAGSFLGLMLLVSAIPCQDASALVGSKSSKKYHVASCQYAKKISAKNLVKFNSAKEAKTAGYAACKVCKPPQE
jgi:methylphosphotriester-DNA--protein-cysteine methyltransferase